MKKSIKPAVALGAMALIASAQAQTATKAATSPTEDAIKRIKNPTEWLSWGADLRLRNEYLGNATTGIQKTDTFTAAQHERDYFRFRGRLFATIKPCEKISLNARITAEPRQHIKGGRQVRPDPWSGNHWDWSEGIIDTLNVKLTEPGDLPITLTLGRQDMFFGDQGDWWLVADGSPMDGSRTMFFDAARLTLNLKEQKTTVDFVYIDQDAMNDRWLPPINHLEKNLIEQDERGAIVYLSNKSIENIQLDGYFIYKGDHVNDTTVNRGLPTGNNGHTYTFGAKITGDFKEHWRYSLESAYQMGERAKNNSQLYRDIEAYAAKARLSYLFKDKMNSQARVSFEFVSGDDSGSAGTDEGFDILWGRYPRWSDVYVFTYGAESRSADNSNIMRFGPGFTTAPIKKMTFSADYNALIADQSRATPTVALGTGSFRGHFIQTVARYKFNDHVSTGLFGEYLWAGNFYTTRDLLLFFRGELTLTF